MADQNRDAEPVSALALQFSFPEPGTAVVAAARITEDQELVLVRKAGACGVGPPLCDGMGGKFGRIIGVAQIDIALVMDDVIDAIRHGPTQRIAREIMQIDLLRRLTPSATLVGEVADQFLVLGIDTDDRIAGAQALLSHTTNVVKLAVAVSDSDGVLGKRAATDDAAQCGGGTACQDCLLNAYLLQLALASLDGLRSTH